MYPVKTPWVICLDADQVVTPELKIRLSNFNYEAYSGTNGIYFNRKNFFKGRWIRHGGHIKFWSRRTLSQLLVDKGFRIVTFKGCGRVPYFWKSMVIKAQLI